MLVGQIGFWVDGLFDFDNENRTQKLHPIVDDASRKRVVIVGREYYFESFHDYPIGDARDLRRVIENEVWSFPHPGIRFTRIERLSERAHRVTNWVVKEEVLEKLAFRPWFLVPETACISALQGSEPRSYCRLDKTVYVVNTSGGVVSGVYRSEASPSASEDRARDRFKASIASVGVSEVNWSYIDEDASPSLIYRGLFELFKTSATRFFLPLKFSNSITYPWLRALKLSVVLITSYLLISSVYLWGSVEWVNFRLHGLAIEAEKSVTTRKETEQQQLVFESIKNVVGDMRPLWVAWDVFIDLQVAGVTVMAVNSSDSEITYYAIAEKASDVLSLLMRDSRITYAEYSEPIRQQSDGQHFAVKVALSINNTNIIDRSEAEEKSIASFERESTLAHKTSNVKEELVVE